MGTRGLVGIVVDKKKKTMYNHFDSYPDCLGNAVVKFVKTVSDESGWKTFKQASKKLKMVKKATPKLIEKYKEFCNTDVSTNSNTDLYCLFRNLQGAPFLEHIYNGTLEHYINDSGFLKDSLFCEYAYLINLDTMKLDCYEGYQKATGKFNKDGSQKYKMCKKVASYSLKNVPENWADCYKKDDDND